MVFPKDLFEKKLNQNNLSEYMLKLKKACKIAWHVQPYTDTDTEYMDCHEPAHEVLIGIALACSDT